MRARAIIAPDGASLSLPSWRPELIAAAASILVALSACGSGNDSPRPSGAVAARDATLATPSISFVQVAAATPQTGQTSVAVKYGLAQTAGNLNVVVVGWSDTSANVASITDTSGNAYTRAVGPTTVAGALSQSVYYAKNITGAAAGANTVTITFSVAAKFADIRILEYSGVDPTTPVDVTAASSSAGGTTSDSGTAVTTNANDLLFGANTVTSTTTAAGAGFTSRIITKSDGDIAEDEVVSTVGTYHATAPIKKGAWVMQMVAFRGASPTPDTQPPSAPSAVAASPVSGAQINVSWAASTDNVGVTGYLLERCQGSGCTSFAQIASPTTTSYSDTGLAASTTYTYRVRATDAAGNLSAYSTAVSATTLAPDTQPPSAPTNLAASAASSSQINLTWSASTDNVGVTGYFVERCVGAGCVSFAQIAAPATTSFSDTGLTATTTYTYRVRATDAAGNLGGYSATASATTLSTPPPGPITFVQVAAATPQTAQTSVAVKYGLAQTAGNLNVIVVGWSDTSANVASITDTSGNAYTRAVGPTTVAGALSQSVYYAKNIAAAAAGANTVTVSFSAGAQFPDVRILEYSGIDPTAPVDGTAGSSGTGTTSDSGLAVTTYSNDLLVGANTITSGTTAAGTGYTSRMITNPDSDIVEDRVVTGAGSYRATATISSGTWVMQLVAFRSVLAIAADTQPPTTPTNLAAAAWSGSQINLTWTPSTDNVAVTGYLVERCQGAGCTNFAQVAAPAVVGFNDTGLLTSASYTYRVRATDAAGNLSAYSGTSTATTGFVLTPHVAVVTPQQMVQFASSLSGVSWSVNGLVGGSASVGSISPTGLYTPPAAIGSFTVQASTSGETSSATVFVTDYAGTYTLLNDNQRTGRNLAETVLTPSNVNGSRFGLVSSYAVDGVPQASPLYVANVNTPAFGLRNVLYVATEHDSIYAFDADGLSPVTLWRVSFINPAGGVTTVTPADVSEYGDIVPEIGITGTPAIDPATGTLYVVAKTKETVGSTVTFVQRLHALDLATGAEKFGGPVVIQASVSGTGSGSAGGQLAFDSLDENQRPALLLNNGTLYIGFASHGDILPWHGWVLAYAAGTLRSVFAFCGTPNGYGGGMWQAGGGMGADANGYVYFVSGNGTFDANSGGRDYGDTFTKLSPTGPTVVDYFTPYVQATLESSNLEPGAGGSILIPDQPGPHTHLMIGAGKNQTVYVVDRDNMGHYNSTSDTQIVQSLINIFPNGIQEPGVFTNPAYFQSASGAQYVYFGPVQDAIQAFQLNNGLLTTAAVSRTVITYDYPGGSFAVSANGNAAGILWAVERPGGYTTTQPGVLHAYDATNLSNELYRGSLGDVAVKFTIPLVANGRVYVAAQGRVDAFGLTQ